MTASLTEHPYAIHVGVRNWQQTRFETFARSAGMSVIQLDLSGVVDRTTLAARLAETFMFPNATRGLDAAIDLISDLEWFGNSNGYLVVVDGLNQNVAVVEPFASILPNIVDRWRAQAVPFTIAISAKSERLMSALAAANHAMAEAGLLPWAQPGTGAVDVIDHSSDEPLDES